MLNGVGREVLKNTENFDERLKSSIQSMMRCMPADATMGRGKSRKSNATDAGIGCHLAYFSQYRA
jgi:hypothetical protein